MATLSLQLVVACLKLVFGGIAARIAAHPGVGGPASAQGAWWITAFVFLLSGAGGLLQSLWAVVAVARGAGDPVYAAFLAWTPAMNYSRIFLVVAYGVVLAALPLLGAFARRRPWIAGALLGAFALGAAVGWMEGHFERAEHYTWLSVSETAELIVLLAALLVALLARSLDWVLWGAVFLYAFRQAINAIFWAAASWSAVPEAWHPPFWLLQGFALAGWALMIALAGHRLRLARRGRAVGAPLEPPRPQMLSTAR